MNNDEQLLNDFVYYLTMKKDIYLDEDEIQKFFASPHYFSQRMLRVSNTPKATTVTVTNAE